MPKPRPGPRTTYKYSEAFKASAVRLSQLQGVSVQEVADSLYIHPFMLSRWRKQARDGSIIYHPLSLNERTHNHGLSTFAQELSSNVGRSETIHTEIAFSAAVN